MKFGAHADTRALVGGLVLGTAVGSLLGLAYWAGDTARASADAVAADAAPRRPAVEAPVRPPLAAVPAAFTAAPRAAPAVRRDVDCLTDAVYYEARGESQDGQAAIAQVVLNRVRHPAYPKSICGVVYQGARQGDCQFSFACNGALDAHREPAAWTRARAVAERALAGFVMPVVGDATSFHIASVRPGWGNMMRVAQIGVHVFYRFGGHAGAARTILASAAPQMGSMSDDAKPAGQYLLASAVTTQAPTPTGSQTSSQTSAPAQPASQSQTKPAAPDTSTTPSS